jgi:hypothetical protein
MAITLMGDLNPFAGFRQPATGCQYFKGFKRF